MRLKKAILQGFKSFAQRTTIPFHEGITCIVGPNGCGKSNVADAFRWVLGEQSARALRGHKMEDVIFAGSDRRTPLPYAEVTLLLDNSEGKLPIDYTEVAITRRLHRDGESEYLLNDLQVRLKEIHALFFDTGIGKDSFAFFEQGKIDQIIQLSPLERRALLHEAAGIIRFLTRKGEALRRLEQTQQQLMPLEQLHGNATERLLQLDREAAEALAYKEKTARKARVEQLLARAQWHQAARKESRASEEEQSHRLSIEEKSGGLADKKETLHQLRLQLDASQRSWQAKNEQLHELRKEQEIAKRDGHHLEEKLSHHRRGLEQTQKESTLVATQLQQMSSQLQQFSLENKQLTHSLQELGRRVNGSRESVRLKRHELETRQSQLQATSEANHTIDKQLAQQETELNHTLVLIQSTTQQADGARSRHAEKLKRQLFLQKELEERKTTLEQLAQQVELHRNDRLRYEQQELTLGEELHQLEEELKRDQAELSRLQGRLQLLKAMRETMEGLSSDAKQLLEASASPSSPFFSQISPLYQLLTPQAGSEVAVATALQRYGQLLIVPTCAACEAVLLYAKEQQLSSFALFCLEWLPSVEKPSAQENLAERVTTSHPQLARHLLSTASSDIPLQELFDGTPLSTPLWWCHSYWIDEKGALFAPMNSQASPFLREAEIAQLQSDLDSRSKALLLLQTNRQATSQQLQEARSCRSESDKLFRSCEMKHLEANFSLQRTTAELRSLAEELELLRGQQEQANEQLQKAQRKGALFQEQVDQLRSQRATLAARTEGERQELDLLQKQLKQEQTQLADTERQWYGLRDRERQLLHEMELLEERESGSLLQQQQLQARQLEHSTQLEALQAQQTQITERLQRDGGILELLDTRCRALQEAIEKQKSEEKLTSEALHKLQQELLHEQQQAERRGSEREKWRQMREEGAARYLHRYGVAPETPSPLDLEGKTSSLEQLEEELQQLIKELDATSNVNMKAIEERERLQSQLSSMGEQLRDLQQTMSELLALIEQLSTQSRRQFKETFQQVQANFRKNFALLFEGGEADLKLTEAADPLEAGIEIFARPPGKQMRSISLLSGGEKCLTALALLFALFEVCPAPYCILDEVDAPLDDTNVERFVQMVRHFGDRCQFIIVTHNKRTMAIADRLFGVTMEEKGISKLLSVDFVEEQRTEVALHN